MYAAAHGAEADVERGAGARRGGVDIRLQAGAADAGRAVLHRSSGRRRRMNREGECPEVVGMAIRSALGRKADVAGGGGLLRDRSEVGAYLGIMRDAQSPILHRG